ncbi:MAG TPA: lysophospholipid acyltransferase family protein [Candidatus Binatia bacterium]
MIYSLKALLICIVTPPSALLILLLAPFDRNGRLAYAVGRLWASMILKIAGVRVQVRGLDRLDPARPYIFIANHQSNVDIPALIKSLPGFQLRWIAKKQLAYIPFFGWALWASRHILVDRSNRAGAMASLRQSKERLAAGISVVIFPEGTRGADAELLPFKRGGFLLAVQTKTPIVPVTINGSRSILPRADWRLRAGEIEVVVDEPIAADAKDASALAARVRQIIESNARGGAPDENAGGAEAAAESLELG